MLTAAMMGDIDFGNDFDDGLLGDPVFEALMEKSMMGFMGGTDDM